MAVLDEIEDWFRQRSRWEWQAFLAIASCQTLDAATIDRLTAVCLDDAATQTKSSEAVASQRSQTPVGAVVNILSIENVQGINRLTPGQRLSFQSEGVTVVYGDNGAGKTGYTRILRQVCRARGLTSKILNDVFADGTGVGSADIIFSEGGHQEKITCETNAQLACPLQHVSIFDACCATALVDDENDAAFRPFGLDILDHFTTLADTIRGRLQAKLNTLSKPAIDAEQFPASTSVGTNIRRLASSASARVELADLALLNEEELNRCKDLEQTLNNFRTDGPDKLATRLTALARRLEVLRTRLTGIAKMLQPQQIDAVTKLHAEKQVAIRAVEVFRDETFSDETMSGVGGAEWQAMWAAARKYAVAHPGTGGPFPAVATGDRCVLCAQELDAKAATRFSTLDQFVKSNLQQRAEELHKSIEIHTKTFEGLVFEAPLDADLFGELAQESEDCATEVKAFLSNAKDLVQNFLACLRSGGPIPTFPPVVPPDDKISPVIDGANARAAQFLTLNNVEERQNKQKEFEELSAASGYPSIALL